MNAEWRFWLANCEYVFSLWCFPQSFAELAGTHFCVSTSHPHSICLSGSLAYSRYSIHVYWMKVLFLRAWWGSTAEWVQRASFPRNSSCAKRLSWWESESWTVEKTDSPPWIRWMYGKVWDLRASLPCDESEHVRVCRYHSFIPGLWKFPAWDPSHQEPAFRILSSLTVLFSRLPSLYNSSIRLQLSPNEWKMGRTQVEVSSPEWRPVMAKSMEQEWERCQED